MEIGIKSLIILCGIQFVRPSSLDSFVAYHENEFYIVNASKAYSWNR